MDASQESPAAAVPWTDLTRFCRDFFLAHDVPEENARTVADVVVETEAFGRSTHGLAQLPFLQRRLGQEIDPAGEPKIIGGRGGMFLLDGRGTMGPLALRRACDLAAERVAEHAIVLGSVAGTNWVGALGPYLIPLAQRGWIVQAWGQIDKVPRCAPYGGRDRRFGTNPIALAFPGPSGGDPVLADFSTSTLSLGTSIALKKEGRTTEEPRFLDAGGRPSRDPAVLWEEGSLMPAGGEREGYKGYGLSLFNEALTAMARKPPADDEPSGQNLTLQVIDPTAFGPADVFQSRLDQMLEYVLSSRPRSDGEVRLPGSRGFAALHAARENGIPLDEKKVAMLGDIAEANGLKAVV